jgi:integrase
MSPKEHISSIMQIFRFAIARELASRNPAADFKPRDVLAATEPENFAHVDEKDLPELLVKMDSYKRDALTRFGLKLMACCFPRTSELIEAPWTEFDLNRAHVSIQRPNTRKAAWRRLRTASAQRSERTLAGSGRSVPNRR